MNDLDYIIFENDIAVCESLENCLEKAELMLENSGYSESLDDFVSEMFDVYMEATQRRKKADEIDAYMKKHNWGDTKSKTPANAKKARQVRNFLMMHDFDPKTSTIKSDYVDDKGKSGRIKFSMTAKDGGHFYSDKQKIAINGLRGTQQNRALTLTHEKGHEMFERDGRHKYWSKQENKSERGIKFIDKAKSRGRDINTHDDGSYLVQNQHQSPEELEADLHAAKNARVRTKYAGRKRAVKRSGATRNVNRNEIRKHFKDMEQSIDNVSRRFTSGISIEEREYWKNYKMLLVIMIEDLLKLYGKCDIDSLHLATRSKKTEELALQRFTSNKDEYLKIMENHEQFTPYIEEIKKTYADKFRKFEINICNTYDTLTKTVNEIEEINKYIASNDIDENERNRLTGIVKQFETRINSLKPTIDVISREHPGISKSVEYLGDKLCLYRQRAYDALKQNPNVGIAMRFFIAVKELNPKFLKECSTLLKKRIEEDQKIIDKMSKAINELKKNTKKWFDDSTKMRHDFVQHYVHEYFTEFMSDYYSFENVFYDDETG